MSLWLKSFQDETYPSDAWELMSTRITAQRRQRMLQTAARRTKYLRLVLQDIADPHNVGACLRSAEAFGVLCCDLVNTYEPFGTASTVSRGADQWLELRRFNDIALYIEAVRSRGYRIAAAYPGGPSIGLEELPLDQPLAIVFGNERRGLDPAWEAHVDYRFTIPMVGMVESFNISVSTALTLQSLNTRARTAVPWNKYLIDPETQKRLLDQWVCRHSRDPEKELAYLREQRSG
ncbi:MAG: RNA methyltransferase [Proteobacteria bacterium]|nr:RNA methyltransferase [Pseudomonadota bacterium]